jgi:hypothetical protein
VVVWPGGALTGPHAEVAGELDRLGAGQDALDRGAAWAIRQFLTDPATADTAPWSSTRARTWSTPAIGYWLSGATNQPGHHTRPPVSGPGVPRSVPPLSLPDLARSRPQHGPPDRTTIPEPTAGPARSAIGQRPRLLADVSLGPATGNRVAASASWVCWSAVTRRG